MPPTPDAVKFTDYADYNLAKDKAAAVLRENFVNSPPVNVFALVRNYGLTVAYASFTGFEDVAGYINLETSQIVVNELDAPSRQKFTIAHELGHWIMHRQMLEADPQSGVMLRMPLGRPDTDPREKEANTFAAHLLVPDEFLKRNLEAGERLSDLAGGEKLLATVFGVSQEVVGFRLKNEGVYAS